MLDWHVYHRFAQASPPVGSILRLMHNRGQRGKLNGKSRVLPCDIEEDQMERQRSDVHEATGFGRLGLDVGAFGRWARLGWGILILTPLAVGSLRDVTSSGGSPQFYGLAGIYLVAITLAYTAVYGVFGERVFARANPWFNTLVFVGPAFVVGWWNMAILPATGFALPQGLSFAMTAYIGLSFILQWKIRYGGCEVVSIPVILFRRRYPTYCIPLVALDAAEKVVVDRVSSRRAALAQPGEQA